jgi:hypothetical protein
MKRLFWSLNACGSLNKGGKKNWNSGKGEELDLKPVRKRDEQYIIQAVPVVPVIWFCGSVPLRNCGTKMLIM